MTDKPPFRLDDFLPYQLSVAANAVSDAVSATYQSSHQLRTQEWRLIAVLAEDGALTPLAIGQRTRMDKVSVSRAAMTLMEKGYVRRTPNPVDQRSHLLSLTPQGQEVHQTIVPRALAVQARIVEDFTEEERRTLASLLARALHSASR